MRFLSIFAAWQSCKYIMTVNRVKQKKLFSHLWGRLIVFIEGMSVFMLLYCGGIIKTFEMGILVQDLCWNAATILENQFCWFVRKNKFLIHDYLKKHKVCRKNYSETFCILSAESGSMPQSTTTTVQKASFFLILRRSIFWTKYVSWQKFVIFC